MPLLRRLSAAIAVAFMVVLGAGTMATAAESGGVIIASEQPDLDPESAYSQADGPAGNVCGVGSDDADSELSEAQNLLPVNRWGSVVTQFPRNPNSGVTNLDVLVGQTSTQMFGGLVFGLSSSMWSMNTALTSLAINFCPIDSIGGQIDSFVGTLGTVILTGGGPLIAAVGAIVIVTVLWQMRRGTLAPLRQIAVKAAAIAALAVMTMGAANSWTEANQHQDASWDPPWYSPGGLIVEMNNAASGISSGSVEWIMDSLMQETGALTNPSDRRGSAHCHWMIDAGHNNFSEAVGPGAGLISGMSQTWVGTTYDAWTRALFGDEYSVAETSGMGARDIPHYYIPCRIAEWYADAPNSLGDALDQESSVHRSVSKNHYLAAAFVEAGAMPEGNGVGYPSTFSNPNGSAPSVYIANLDNSMYWALTAGMCHDPQFSGDSSTSPTDRVDSITEADINWEVARVWHGGGGSGRDQRTLADRLDGSGSSQDISDNGEFDTLCRAFWTHGTTDGEDGWSDNPISEAGFHIHGSRGNIQDGFSDGDAERNPSGPGAVAMVNFMTSANVGDVTFEGLGSAIASGAVLLIMIPILIVLSLVRLMMVMMMLGLFVSLLMALLPNQNFEAFMKTLKMTIGMILLSIFVQVIFSLIMGIMLMLNDMGGEVMNTGSVMYAFWTAVTPWIAVLGVHFTFKFLKLPSPLKLGSAMEWGNAMAKQGADSMGSKAGSMTGGGGAGDKSKGMADKLRKRKGGNDGSDSRGSGSDRQAGQEQTEARKGSQRGVLAKVGAGASALGGKAKSQAGKELGGNEASAAAKAKKKTVRDKVASVKANKKLAQRKELDTAKDELWANKKSMSAEEKQASKEGIKAMKSRHKDELGDLDERGKKLSKQVGDRAKGARGEAVKATWAARKKALGNAAGKLNERREKLGLQAGQEGRQQWRENMRGMSSALKSAPGAAAGAAAKGARALPGAALRAAAGANKSEGLTTKQLAGRAARNTAVVGGLGAVAMAGGAPLAAMGGAAMLGGGALGAKRAWNTMTSKNEGSVRSRVGSAAGSVKDSLNGASRDPSIAGGGEGPTTPDSGGPDTPPDASGGDSGGPTPDTPDVPNSGGGASTPVTPTVTPTLGGPSGGGVPTPPDTAGGDSGGRTTEAGSSSGGSTGSQPVGGVDPRTGSWQPSEDATPVSAEAPTPETGSAGDSSQMPDFNETPTERASETSESGGGKLPGLGSLAGGAIAGAAAAKGAVDKMGNTVENFSPVDDQATLDEQREDKKFREALSGGDPVIPGYNAPSDADDSRELSLDEKGGPPPMPPEPTSDPFNDGPEVHHSGEDFAARMRRLKDKGFGK